MGRCGGVDLLVGEILEVDLEIGKGFRHCEFVLIDDEDIPVCCGEMREIFLMNADDEGHEIFISSVDEVERQVVDKHVLPLQRLD